MDLQPSKETVRYLPNMIPGVRGCPSGPARISNSLFTGGIPIRRRRSRRAFPEGAASPSTRSPAVSLPHTP